MGPVYSSRLAWIPFYERTQSTKIARWDSSNDVFAVLSGYSIDRNFIHSVIPNFIFSWKCCPNGNSKRGKWRHESARINPHLFLLFLPQTPNISDKIVDVLRREGMSPWRHERGHAVGGAALFDYFFEFDIGSFGGRQIFRFGI